MSTYLEVAKRTLKIEADSILNLIPRLGKDFEKAADLIKASALASSATEEKYER